jgi:hypothetical protein
MSISTFDSVVPESHRQQAHKAYDAMAQTQDGQKTILQNASSGDGLAAIYLYDRLQRVITKAFWKYYLGPNKATRQKRLEGGAASEFAQVAFEVLIDGNRQPSPYKTFDPKKFSTEADLIKQFGYYLYRYMQNEAFKMLGAAAGNKPKDVVEVGYDAVGEAEGEAAVPSHSADIDEQIAMNDFYKYVKRRAPAIADIAKLLMRGLSISEVADELGKSKMYIHKMRIKIQQLWKEFDK